MLLTTLHLWSAAAVRPPALQPELLYTLRGGEGPTWSIAFSPRGDLLAAGSQDGSVRLWDARTGRLRRALPAHPDAMGSVASSPDGSLLATGSADGTVKLWRVASGRLLRSLPQVEGPLAFSPNGRLLATSDGISAQLWDTRTWRTVATLRPPRPPLRPLRDSADIAQIAFAPDGKSLATVEGVSYAGEPPSEADFVQLWDTATWRARRTLRQPEQTQIHIAFAPDSRRLAVAGGWSYRGKVLLWNLPSGKTRSLLSVDEVDTVTSIAYDPHGRWVAVDSGEGVRFLDVASGKQFRVIQVGGTSFTSYQEAALSPDASLLAATRSDGLVEVWRLSGSLQRAEPLARANAPAVGLDVCLVP